MKSSDSRKPKTKSKSSAGYLAARALEAEKQAEAARKLARLAKSRYKGARKAFKQAKKFAKQARKEAKLAAKALKDRIDKARKAHKKKVVVRKPGKISGHRATHTSLAKPKSPSKSPKSLAPAAPVRDAVLASPEVGSSVAKP